MAGERNKGRRGKVLGYVLTGLGALSILDFFSPVPIPTTGVTAFVTGGLLIAGGLYVLYLRDLDWKGLLRRTVSRQPVADAAKLPPLDPLVPVAILRLAQAKGGVLTVSAVAMALSVPMDVAERGLDECAQRGAATAEYDEAKSTVTYRFPEFLPPPDRPRLT